MTLPPNMVPWWLASGVKTMAALMARDSLVLFACMGSLLGWSTMLPTVLYRSLPLA
jgi:hypothetical protein